jgi:short subunit dehydrogenase-like uncharacterized protein
MHESAKIVLIGAYGYTAQLIAANLSARGISFSIAGRDGEKLAEMKRAFSLVDTVHEVDIESSDAMQHIISQYKIVVNCIGPYNIYGNLVLEKCVDGGCCYIDLCGEQHFVHQSMERFGKKAVQTGACIFHSVAFESALVDLLAKVNLPEGEAWESIASTYYFEKSRPSPGTRITMLTSQYFPVYSLDRGTLVEGKIAGFAREIEYSETVGPDAALFAPYPEVLFFKNRYRVNNACSYLLTSRLEAQLATGRKPAEGNVDVVMEENKKRIKKGPTEQERHQQAFEIRLLAESSAGKRHCFLLKGNDMYGVTASIATIYISRLLSLKQIPAGVFSPSQIDDPEDVFNEILKENLIECRECTDIRILSHDLIP